MTVTEALFPRKKRAAGLATLFAFALGGSIVVAVGFSRTGVAQLVGTTTVFSDNFESEASSCESITDPSSTSM